jgi:hypothetical protein
MKTLLLIAVLLSGCSLFNVPPDIEFKPSIQRDNLNITIRIEDDFSRFGEMVGGHAVCVKDYCILTLPKIKVLNDKQAWCTWGVMLGFVVYGKLNDQDKIDICNAKG